MLSQAALSSAAEGNFWSERRAAARRMNAANSDDGNAGSPATSGLLAQLPQPGQWDFTPPPAASAGGGLTVSAVAQTAEMESSFPGLPSGLAAAVLPYGTIREAHLPKNPTSPLVVHIQDAHGIEEAQRNISAMIAALSAPSRGKLIVGLEGAEGPFVTPALRQAGSADVVKDVADYFLKEGRITGAEYAALTAEVPPFLWGVEKWEDYQADVQSVKDAHPLTLKSETVLKDLGAQADKLKEKIYSAELKEFDRRLAAYRAGSKLGDHVRYMMRKGPAKNRDFPNLALLLDALDAEDALDFKLVERERRQLVELLASKCPKSVLDDLVQKSISYRSGRWTGGRYHAYLKDLCRSRDIRLGKDFPRMWAYINYVILSDGINRENLLDEISAREQTVEAALARTPEQKRLAAAARRLGLLDSLIHHKMTPNDWAEYEKNRDGILGLPKELDELAGNPATSPAAGASLSAPLLKPFEDFCGLALKRNEALADNLLAKIAKETPAGKGPSPIAVLVAGGFHTEDLVRRFTEKGAGIVVVTPKITEVPKDSNYMDVFVREPLPLEKMFRGEPISLVNALGFGARAGAFLTNLWISIIGALRAMKEDVDNVVRESNKVLAEAAQTAGPGWSEARVESVENRNGSRIALNPLPEREDTPLVQLTVSEGEGTGTPSTAANVGKSFSFGGHTFVSTVRQRSLPVRLATAVRRWISAQFNRSVLETSAAKTAESLLRPAAPATVRARVKAGIAAVSARLAALTAKARTVNRAGLTLFLGATVPTIQPSTRPGFVFDWLFDLFRWSKTGPVYKFFAVLLGPALETAALRVLLADPTGTGAKIIIAGLFLSSIVSLAVAKAQGRIKWGEFFRRLGAQAASSVAMAVAAHLTPPGSVLGTAAMFALAHPDAWMELFAGRIGSFSKLLTQRFVGGLAFSGLLQMGNAGTFGMTQLAGFVSSLLLHQTANFSIINRLGPFRKGGLLENWRPFFVGEAGRDATTGVLSDILDRLSLSQAPGRAVGMAAAPAVPSENIDIVMDALHQRERIIAPGYEDFENFSALHSEAKEILDRLLQVEGLDVGHFNLYLIDSMEPNAFVMPHDGKVFVSLGMMRMLSKAGASRDALAAVLAHELIHVRQHLQDVAAGRAQAKKGLILRNMEERAREYQADLAALSLMDKAGFSVKDAPVVFRALMGWLQERKIKGLPWGSHPEMEERVRKMERFILEHHWENYFRDPQPISPAASTQALQRTRYRIFQKRVMGVKKTTDLEPLLREARTVDELLFVVLVGKKILGIQNLFKEEKRILDERVALFAAGDPAKAALFGFLRDYVENGENLRLESIQSVARPLETETILRIFELGIPDIFAAKVDVDPLEKDRGFRDADAALGNMSNAVYGLNMYGTGFLWANNGELLSRLKMGRLTLEETRRIFLAIKRQEDQAGAMHLGQDRIRTNRYDVSAALLDRFVGELTADDLAGILSLYQRTDTYGTGFNAETGASEILAFLPKTSPAARSALLSWLERDAPDPVESDGDAYRRETSEIRLKIIRDDAHNFLSGKPSFLFTGSPTDLDNLLSQDKLVKYFPEGIAKFLRDSADKVSAEQLVSYHKKALKHGKWARDIFLTMLFKKGVFAGDAFEKALIEIVEEKYPSLLPAVKAARRELKPLLYVYALGGDLGPNETFFFESVAEDTRGNMFKDPEIALMAAKGKSEFEEEADAGLIARVIGAREVDDATVAALDQWWPKLTSSTQNEIIARWNQKYPKPVPVPNVRTEEFGFLSTFLRSVGKPNEAVDIQALFYAVNHPVRLTKEDARRDTGSWSAFGDALWVNVIDKARAAMRNRPQRGTRLVHEKVTPAEILALYDFVDRLPADYQQAVDLVAHSLESSVFRNFVLHSLFVDRVLNRRYGAGLSREEAFDLRKVQAAMGRLTPNARRAVMAEVKVLTKGPSPLLVHDVAVETINKRVVDLYALERAFDKSGVDEAKIRAEHAAEMAAGDYDDAFYSILGGPLAQLNIFAASTADAALAEVLAQPGDWKAQRQEILDLYPEKSPARDRWLEALLKAHGFRGPPAEVAATLALFADSALRDNLAFRALNELRTENAEPFKTLDGSLDAIRLFFPDPSPLRDDILEETAQRLAGKPEQYKRIKDLLVDPFRSPDKEVDKQAAQATFVHDLFRVLIKNLTPTQKSETLLWLMGLSEKKPFYLVHAEHSFHVQFDGIRNLYAHTESEFYPEAGMTAHREAMEPFLYGEKGLLTDPAASKEFLDRLFNAAVPAGSTSGILKSVYDAAFQNAEPERREEIFLALTRSLSDRTGEGTSLSNEDREARTIRVFLQSLGLVGVKVGQFLASSPTVPAHIRKELGNLKDRARKMPKGIVFDMLRILFGPFSSDAIEEVGVPLGSASIKVVYRAKYKGRWVALKLKRPEVEKRVEADIAFMRNVLRTKTVLDALKNEGVPLPKRLMSFIEQVIREEMNFDQESDNTKRLRQNLATRSLLKRAGSWFFEKVAPLAWPPSKKKPQFSVPESIRVVKNSAILEELVDGVPLAQYTGEDAADLQRAAAREFLRQVFVDGFYHADPHTGNIIVGPDGNLTLIDVGAASTISLKSRLLLKDIFTGVGRRNGEGLIKLVANLINEKEKTLPPEQRMSKSRKEKMISDIHDAFKKYLLDSSESLTTRLLWFFQVAEDHEVPLPDDLFRIFRFLGAGGELFEVTEKGTTGPAAPGGAAGPAAGAEGEKGVKKVASSKAATLGIFGALMLYPTSIFGVLSAFVPLSIRISLFLLVAAFLAVMYGARLGGMVQRSGQVAGLGAVSAFYSLVVAFQAALEGRSGKAGMTGGVPEARAPPLRLALFHFLNPREWMKDAGSIMKGVPAFAVILLSFLAPSWQSLIFPDNLSLQLALGFGLYALSLIFRTRFNTVSGRVSGRMKVLAERMRPAAVSTGVGFGKLVLKALPLASVFLTLLLPQPAMAAVKGVIVAGASMSSGLPFLAILLSVAGVAVAMVVSRRAPRNYFEALGISPTVDREEIYLAYRAILDAPPGSKSEEDVRAAEEAYNQLMLMRMDDRKLVRYLIAHPSQPTPREGAPTPTPVYPSDVIRAINETTPHRASSVPDGSRRVDSSGKVLYISPLAEERMKALDRFSAAHSGVSEVCGFGLTSSVGENDTLVEDFVAPREDKVVVLDFPGNADELTVSLIATLSLFETVSLEVKNGRARITVGDERSLPVDSAHWAMWRPVLEKLASRTLSHELEGLPEGRVSLKRKEDDWDVVVYGSRAMPTMTFAQRVREMAGTRQVRFTMHFHPNGWLTQAADRGAQPPELARLIQWTLGFSDNDVVLHQAMGADWFEIRVLGTPEDPRSENGGISSRVHEMWKINGDLKKFKKIMDGMLSLPETPEAAEVLVGLLNELRAFAGTQESKHLQSLFLLAYGKIMNSYKSKKPEDIRNIRDFVLWSIFDMGGHLKKLTPELLRDHRESTSFQDLVTQFKTPAPTRATTPEAEHWGEIIWVSLFASAVGIAATHYFGPGFGALGSILAIGGSVFSLFVFPGFRRFLGGLTSVFGVAGAVEYLRLRGPPKGRKARLETWALSHIDENDPQRKRLVAKDSDQYNRLMQVGKMFQDRQMTAEDRRWVARVGWGLGVSLLATAWPHMPGWAHAAGIIVFGVLGLLAVFPKAAGFVEQVGVHSLYNTLYYARKWSPENWTRFRGGIDWMTFKLHLPEGHIPVRATAAEPPSPVTAPSAAPEIDGVKFENGAGLWGQLSPQDQVLLRQILEGSRADQERLARESPGKVVLPTRDVSRGFLNLINPEGRTVYLTLEKDKPLVINGRIVTVLRLKGVRPALGWFGKISAYNALGRGATPRDVVTTDGKGGVFLHTENETPGPRGTMTEEAARNEFAMGKELADAHVLVDVPLTMGLYTKRQFNNQKTGFVIFGMEGEDYRLNSKGLNTPTYASNYMRNNPREIEGSEATKIFGMLGEALRAMHGRGLIHRYVHQGNVGLVKRADGTWGVVLRDLDNMTRTTEDMSNEDLAGNRFLDVYRPLYSLLSGTPYGHHKDDERVIAFLKGYFGDRLGESQSFEALKVESQDYSKVPNFLHISEHPGEQDRIRLNGRKPIDPFDGEFPRLMAQLLAAVKEDRGNAPPAPPREGPASPARATTPEAEHWGEIIWVSLFASAVGIAATHYFGPGFGALGSILAIGGSVFSLFVFPGFRRFLGGLTSVFGVAGAVEFVRLRGPPEGREARLEAWALSHINENDHSRKVTKDENPGSQYMRLIAAGGMFLAKQETTELKGRSWAGLAIGVLGLAALEGILKFLAPHAPGWVQAAGLIVFGVVGIMQVFPKARGFVVHVGVHSLYNAIYYLTKLIPFLAESDRASVNKYIDKSLVHLGLLKGHVPVRATAVSPGETARPELPKYSLTQVLTALRRVRDSSRPDQVNFGNLNLKNLVDRHGSSAGDKVRLDSLRHLGGGEGLILPKLVDNALDATPGTAGKLARRFGLSVYRAFQDLKSPDDRLIVTSSENGRTGFQFICQWVERDQDYRFTFDLLNDEALPQGTTVEVKKTLTLEQVADRAQAERRSHRVNTRGPILLNVEGRPSRVNEPGKYFYVNGAPVASLPPAKTVHAGITTEGYWVQNAGPGMSVRDFFEKFLPPKEGWETAAVESEDDMAHEARGFFLAQPSGTSDVSLGVSGSEVEYIPVRDRMHVAAEVHIELPQTTQVNEDWKELSLLPPTKGTTPAIEGMKRLIERLTKSERVIPNRFAMINALAAVLRFKQAGAPPGLLVRSDKLEQTTDLLWYLAERVGAQHLLDGKVVLPNDPDWAPLDTEDEAESRTLFLDRSLFSWDPAQVPALKKTELTSDGHPVFTAPLRAKERPGAPVAFAAETSRGLVWIVDEEVYKEQAENTLLLIDRLDLAAQPAPQAKKVKAPVVIARPRGPGLWARAGNSLRRIIRPVAIAAAVLLLGAAVLWGASNLADRFAGQYVQTTVFLPPPDSNPDGALAVSPRLASKPLPKPDAQKNFQPVIVGEVSNMPPVLATGIYPDSTPDGHLFPKTYSTASSPSHAAPATGTIKKFVMAVTGKHIDLPFPLDGHFTAVRAFDEHGKPVPISWEPGVNAQRVNFLGSADRATVEVDVCRHPGQVLYPVPFHPLTDAERAHLPAHVRAVLDPLIERDAPASEIIETIKFLRDTTLVYDYLAEGLPRTGPDWESNDALFAEIHPGEKTPGHCDPNALRIAAYLRYCGLAAAVVEEVLPKNGAIEANRFGHAQVLVAREVIDPTPKEIRRPAPEYFEMSVPRATRVPRLLVFIFSLLVVILYLARGHSWKVAKALLDSKRRPLLRRVSRLTGLTLEKIVEQNLDAFLDGTPITSDIPFSWGAVVLKNNQIFRELPGGDFSIFQHPSPGAKFFGPLWVHDEAALVAASVPQEDETTLELYYVSQSGNKSLGIIHGLPAGARLESSTAVTIGSDVYAKFNLRRRNRDDRSFLVRVDLTGRRKPGIVDYAKEQVVVDRTDDSITVASSSREKDEIVVTKYPGGEKLWSTPFPDSDGKTTLYPPNNPEASFDVRNRRISKGLFSKRFSAGGREYRYSAQGEGWRIVGSEGPARVQGEEIRTHLYEGPQGHVVATAGHFFLLDADGQVLDSFAMPPDHNLLEGEDRIRPVRYFDQAFLLVPELIARRGLWFISVAHGRLEVHHLDANAPTPIPRECSRLTGLPTATFSPWAEEFNEYASGWDTSWAADGPGGVAVIRRENATRIGRDWRVGQFGPMTSDYDAKLRRTAYLRDRPLLRRLDAEARARVPALRARLSRWSPAFLFMPGSMVGLQSVVFNSTIDRMNRFVADNATDPDRLRSVLGYVAEIFREGHIAFGPFVPMEQYGDMLNACVNHYLDAAERSASFEAALRETLAAQTPHPRDADIGNALPWLFRPVEEWKALSPEIQAALNVLRNGGEPILDGDDHRPPQARPGGLYPAAQDRHSLARMVAGVRHRSAAEINEGGVEKAHVWYNSAPTDAQSDSLLKTVDNQASPRPTWIRELVQNARDALRTAIAQGRRVAHRDIRIRSFRKGSRWYTEVEDGVGMPLNILLQVLLDPDNTTKTPEQQAEAFIKAFDDLGWTSAKKAEELARIFISEEERLPALISNLEVVLNRGGSPADKAGLLASSGFKLQRATSGFFGQGFFTVLGDGADEVVVRSGLNGRVHEVRLQPWREGNERGFRLISLESFDDRDGYFQGTVVQRIKEITEANAGLLAMEQERLRLEAEALVGAVGTGKDDIPVTWTYGKRDANRESLRDDLEEIAREGPMRARLSGKGIARLTVGDLEVKSRPDELFTLGPRNDAVALRNAGTNVEMGPGTPVTRSRNDLLFPETYSQAAAVLQLKVESVLYRRGTMHPEGLPPSYRDFLRQSPWNRDRLTSAEVLGAARAAAGSYQHDPNFPQTLAKVPWAGLVLAVPSQEGRSLLDERDRLYGRALPISLTQTLNEVRDETGHSLDVPPAVADPASEDSFRLEVLHSHLLHLALLASENENVRRLLPPADVVDDRLLDMAKDLAEGKLETLKGLSPDEWNTFIQVLKLPDGGTLMDIALGAGSARVAALGKVLNILGIQDVAPSATLLRGLAPSLVTISRGGSTTGLFTRLAAITGKSAQELIDAALQHGATQVELQAAAAEVVASRAVAGPAIGSALWLKDRLYPGMTDAAYAAQKAHKVENWAAIVGALAFGITSLLMGMKLTDALLWAQVFGWGVMFFFTHFGDIRSRGLRNALPRIGAAAVISLTLIAPVLFAWALALPPIVIVLVFAAANALSFPFHRGLNRAALTRQLEKQTAALEKNPGDRAAAAAVPDLIEALMGPLVDVGRSQAAPTEYSTISGRTPVNDVDQLARTYLLARSGKMQEGLLELKKDDPRLPTILWALEHSFAGWGKGTAPSGLDSKTLETLAAFLVLDGQLSTPLPSGAVRAINVTALLKNANAPASVQEAVRALAALADARVALGWDTWGQTVLTANAPAGNPEALALGSRFNNLPMVTGVSDRLGRLISHKGLVDVVRVIKKDLTSLELLTPNPAADVDATTDDLPGVHFVASALRLSDLVQRALRALAVALASA
jgi:predicted unusual protein kinase regulating ubiquinone biosynthesis (AarF/ABC1/UbiB family)/Zn-dependent protease with chaperone function